MKLLLYCTKQMPRLVFTDGKWWLDNSKENTYWEKGQIAPIGYNDKIVAECDYEVEEIKWNTTNWVDNFLTTKSMSEEELQKRSCINGFNLREYFEICYDSINDSVVGYAIHIKNLHIFDEPRELSDYYKFDGIYNNINNWKPIKKAPQNMCYAYEYKCELGFSGTMNRTLNKNILISIRPEWLCKILNGEKTIEVRKKILKEMEGNNDK